MNIAVIFIGLGNYLKYWPGFCNSINSNFCTNATKAFFVFADASKYANSFDDCAKVTLIHQDHLGWPFSTLYRYHLIRKLFTELRQYDFVLFLNANALVVRQVTISEFFCCHDEGLVAGIHPGYATKNVQLSPFETRLSSTAFIENPSVYVQGCINGGTSKRFLDVVSLMTERIDADISSGIMPIWHDESHWNKVINDDLRLNRPVHLLGCEYLWPEKVPFRSPFSALIQRRRAKIIMRQKSLLGNHSRLRSIIKN